MAPSDDVLMMAGQHVESLGAHKGAQETYVLLFATFNCLGRMLCGFFSEMGLHHYALPRYLLSKLAL